jgi:NOL1/NOP2/fmu family ribosome biogenesis protein
MKIQVMDRAKKKKFIAGLEDLGMKKITQMLVKTGQERVRAFSGSLDKDEVYDIWRMLPIEGVGLYVGKDMVNRNGVREIRLSLDGMHVWKDQLTEKNFVLTAEQEEEWFKGNNIDLDDEQKKKFEGVKGFVAVKSSDGKDFVGNGKLGNEGATLFGFLPKERRRKSSTI